MVSLAARVNVGTGSGRIWLAAMPTVLGTLDAIHLVTALLVVESRHVQLAFLTHDDQLATGAHAVGLEVVGA